MQIAKGQGIIELETGKAVAPVPSSASGKVSKILVSVGDKISVGQAILSLGGRGGCADKGRSRQGRAEPFRPLGGAARGGRSGGGAVGGGGRTPTHPPRPPRRPSAAWRGELGIDLRQIHGSEAGGRIVMEDLRAYIRRLQRLAAQPRTASGGLPAKAPPEHIDFSKWGPVSKRPMTALRKLIAQRLSESWNAVPRVTQFDEADITVLDALRKKHAPAYEAKGARLTLTSFALKIVAEALKKHPVFNASLDEAAGDVIYKEYFHIGMAVDTEQGLIVPVLRNADKKDMLTLSKEMNEMAVKTRERKVSMEELQGGTFTISNQGGIGGGHFTPMHQPAGSGDSRPGPGRVKTGGARGENRAAPAAAAGAVLRSPCD